MKLLLSWLREFVDVPVEAARLGEDLTLAGLALEGLETLGSDTLLDLDITTNRVDCMNVYGVAREVSVLYGTALRPLDASFDARGAAAAEVLAVDIEAPDLCPRFCARVLDVRLSPSPSWVRDRLEAVGVRPINNVVDLTNYVMLEMGQPSHAFDLARIAGGRLVVRWGREGERLVTLDGVERRLGARTGVVADPSGPLALAGIMGGASSEVTDETRTVALEAAYWDPLSIRRAAKSLGMHTEASHRFERGADPEGTVTATARIAHLLQRIGGGSTRPGVLDLYVAPRPARRVTLRPSRAARLLGAEVPQERAQGILRGLGFAPIGSDGEGGEGAVFEVPTWRGDVSREVDLIEEVGRHHGLDKIAATLPAARQVGGRSPRLTAERAVRDFLAGAGLVEVVNYSFVPAAPAAGAAPEVALLNPLAEDQGRLRSSLVVPGLLATLQANLRHGGRDVAVFEVGSVFPAGDAGVPREERRLGILLAGASRPPHWSEKPRPVDVFDVKGLLEALAERLGVGEITVVPDADLPPFLHPGRSGRVRQGDEPIGHIGALHPAAAEAWELREGAVVGELDLRTLLRRIAPPRRFQALPRFPPVTRDVSFLCDAAAGAGAVVDRIRAAGTGLLKAALVVDRYDRPPVPQGKVSLTVALRFEDPERTLTGEEVQAAMESIVSALRAGGAEIRGERGET